MSTSVPRQDPASKIAAPGITQCPFDGPSMQQGQEYIRREFKILLGPKCRAITEAGIPRSLLA